VNGIRFCREINYKPLVFSKLNKKRPSMSWVGNI